MSQTDILGSAPARPNSGTLKARNVFMPRADVTETPEALVIYADMPGVDEHGIDVTLEKNVLTLRGHIAEPEGLRGRLTLEEYASGDYERAFVLGNDIDRDTISATVKDGVLKVVLPKAKQARAHKINVRAE